MNDDRNQRRYGQAQSSFDHYDLPAGGQSFLARIVGDHLAEKIGSPFFAVSALLVVGAAFAGVVLASYSGTNVPGETIPMVQADQTAYKEVPSDAGGMEIPGRDTTVFSSMGNEATPEAPPIENLLAGEEPAEKLAAFANQVESGAPTEVFGPFLPSAPVEASSPASAPSSVSPSTSPSSPPVEFKKIVSPEETPETLAFVQSVLDAKDAKAKGDAVPASTPEVVKPDESQKSAELPKPAETQKLAEIQEPPKPVEEKIAKVEPASGIAITAGSFYIQLGSIKSEAAAQGEWAKFQKSFAVPLHGLSYRVKKVELPERGTFYRIQAGPISKDSATSVCNAIKAQKPGGCLVTQ